MMSDCQGQASFPWSMQACKVIFTLIYRLLCPSKTLNSAPGKKGIGNCLCLMGQNKIWSPTAVKKTRVGFTRGKAIT